MADPWLNFCWDWDTKNNNEPSYTEFRSQEPAELCATAGFAADEVFQCVIPDIATFGEENFAAFMAGKKQPPRHGAGGWFVFGARKAARPR